MTWKGLRRSGSGFRAGIEIAAGEYAYTVGYVRRMLEAHAVDVQQADMTRCGGDNRLPSDRGVV